MEGVELTTPSTAATSSPNNTIITPSQQSPPVKGVDSSMHNPNGKGKQPETTTMVVDAQVNSVQNKEGLQQQPQVWITVEKKKRFKVAIRFDTIPGNNNNEKRTYAYNMLKQVDDFTHNVDITNVRGIKVITASFTSESAAAAACKIPISEKNLQYFVGINEIVVDPENSGNTYTVKLIDVPLDADKPILEKFLQNIGETSSIKYQIRDLYYHVVVTYKSADVAQYWSKKWCINVGNFSFRCFPFSLTVEERKLRNAYGIKLANLPKGCTIADLDQVLINVNAKTCFIPKKRNNQFYQRERFAFIQFESLADLTNAQHKSFIVNGRALQWTSSSTKTCHECGSITHLVRNCKEATRKQNIVNNNEYYASIYKRYKVQPKNPKGFMSHQTPAQSLSAQPDVASKERRPQSGAWEAPPEICDWGIEEGYTFDNINRARKQGPRGPRAKPNSSQSSHRPLPPLPRASKPQNVAPIPKSQEGFVTLQAFNDRMNKLESMMANFANQINEIVSKVQQLEKTQKTQSFPTQRSLQFEFSTSTQELVTDTNNNGKRVCFSQGSRSAPSSPPLSVIQDASTADAQLQRNIANLSVTPIATGQFFGNSSMPQPSVSKNATERLQTMENQMADAFSSLGNLNETFTKFINRNNVSGANPTAKHNNDEIMDINTNTQ
jgi:hypothetical protein